MALASRSRIVSLIFAAATLASSTACSVILNPDDDGVQRCSNVDDCDAPDDARFEAVCISDPDANIDTTQVDQVCVAQFKTAGCNPSNFEIDSEFRQLAESRGLSDYSCTDFEGSRGCPPEAGVGCNEGLEVNEAGQCDVPGAEFPAINHVTQGELEAQDVKDQYCRGFFCDESYVCNNETSRCQPCDPEAEVGQGGCGVIYTQGNPSCVYTDQSSEAACEERDPDAAFVPTFGNCE